MTQHLSRIVRELWLFAAFVAVWWWASAGSDSIYFPPLEKISSELVRIWFFDQIRIDFIPSLSRLAVGYGVALVVGVSLGVALGLMRRLSVVIWPLLEAIRAIPGVALLPIFVLFLGVGSTMKISIIAFGAFWPIFLNTVDGVRSVEPLLGDVAKVFHLPFRYRLLYIVLPAASRQIFPGARVGLAIGVILIVVSEMVGANGGLGYFILAAERSFAITEMWTGIIILGMVGYGLNCLFRAAEAKVLRWHFGAMMAREGGKIGVS
jgi:ABC-type nitrate/sulfonate/bicarbonate transport system permease component